MKSYYHDLKTDRIITENEYNKRMNVCLKASLVYFGEYNTKKEAQKILDTEYSYLKNNPYWNPKKDDNNIKKLSKELGEMLLPKYW